MFENKVLICDMIGTLVPFAGEEGTVREGAVDAFCRYREHRNRIVVASSARTDSDVEKALKAHRLLGEVDVFKAVQMSPKLDRFGSQGKLYQPVLDQLGLSDEESQAKVVVIGDSRRDIPGDKNRLVFFYQQHGNRYPFSLVERMIAAISQEGNGHIFEGFKKYKSDNPPVTNLGDGFTATLRILDKLNNPEIGPIEIPMVTISNTNINR